MTAFFAILSTLALASLGLITIVNNPRSKSNRYFLIFCASLGMWVVANYLANADAAMSLFWTRITFTSIVAATMSFRLFVTVFPRRVPHLKVGHTVLFLASTLMFLITWTHYFIPSVKFVNGTSNVVTGALYPSFIVYFILFAGLSIWVLAKQSANLRGIDRARARLILEGLLAVVLIGSVLDLFLPLALGNNQLANVGTYSTVIFAGLIYLAIVRHQLFDIRLIVARSVAYLLLITSVYTVFALILLALTNIFFKGTQIQTGIKVIYLVLAILSAFIFQPLKRVFDKLSNSLFYRDAYDAQELIDMLNSALVTTIDIEELLHKSSRIIHEELKVEFCLFAIPETKDSPFLLVGTDRPSNLTEEKAGHIIAAAQTVPKKVIVADELESRAPTFKELLEQESIGALVKIRGIFAGHSQSQGFILLGEKSSGSAYSSQDIKILEIVTDELVIAIQNSLRFEEIKRFNITLQEKIEEATKQLRHANHRLRELDQTKDEFISMASHQLRTPLTTIKGYLSMVLEGDVGPVTKNEKQMIQQAFDSAERMVFLIADLLNVSRLQSGKFVIDNKPTDLAKMVESEVAQLKETAENHHLTMSYKKPEKFPLLNLDDNKIRQVVMNFMDNAIYYTPSGGSIEVSLAATDHEISYTVTDTGLGVPKAEQHHLFSKFFRAGNARKMRPDGTGLGLFMAKKVIIAQGGAIIFKSTEGKGSTFGFSFPRKAVELKEAASKENPKGPTPEPAKAVAVK